MREKPRAREEWEIREDARMLARAEEIKADKERLKEALKMANEIANEELSRVSGILKVAGKQPPKMPKNTKNSPQFNINRRGYPNPATIGRL